MKKPIVNKYPKMLQFPSVVFTSSNLNINIKLFEN